MVKRRTAETWKIEQEATAVITGAFIIEATIALARMHPDPPQWVALFMERLHERVDWLQIAAREVEQDRSAVYDVARVCIEKWTGYCLVRSATDD
jgi:hypothetical protein